MKRMSFILGRKTTEKQSVNEAENTELLCRKTCGDITENFVMLANEPSLAYFRIQEHVRKSTPTLLEERNKILKLQADLQGRCFDLDYAIKAIDATSRATSHLVRLNELLKSSLFTKLQLDYAQRQSSTFELGIDAASFIEDTESVVSSSRVFTHKKGQRVERPPSLGNEVIVPTIPSTPVGASSDFLSNLVSPHSAASTNSNGSLSRASTIGFDVRPRAPNMTKRALYTRSVDISSTETGNVYSALSYAEIPQSTASVNEPHERKSFESLSESNSSQMQLQSQEPNSCVGYRKQ